MNKTITYVLLGGIFVAMALLIVFQAMHPVSNVPSEGADQATVVAQAPETTEEKEPVKSPSAKQEPQESVVSKAQDSKAQDSDESASLPEAVTDPEKQAKPATKVEQKMAGTAKPGKASSKAMPEKLEESARPEVKAEAKKDVTADAQPKAKPQPPAAVVPNSKEAEKKAAKLDKKADDVKAEQKTQKKEPAPRAGYNAARSITIRATADGVALVIDGAGPIGEVKQFVVKSPNRVVVDILGRWERFTGKVSVPKNSVIKDVRTGIHPDKLRIVADIKGQIPKRIKVSKKSRAQVVVTMKK